MSEYYCSVAAESRNEEIFATASYCQFFMLVGYKDPFPYSPPKAYLAETTSWYLQLIKEVKLRKGKLLLIRTDEPVIYYVDHFNSRHFAVDYSKEGFNTGLLWNHKAVKWQEEDFFLVCTNGKRDKCCSLRGMPAFKAFKKFENQYKVFQCSHVGGDRFAANIVHMPSGVYYGWVTESDVPAIIDATENNSVLLKNFRGRAIQNLIRQAADYFLRKEFQILTIESGIEWLQFHNHSDNYTAQAVYKEQTIELQIQRVASEIKSKLTCNAANNETHYEFKLNRIHILN